MTSSLAKPTLLDPTACPACRAPLESLWFCPRDGSIGREGRFTIAKHYVAEELLGAGESSFVYAGHRDGKPVAIKLLRDADTSSSSPAVRRFLREARNASQLAHDNTIAILEFGHDEALNVPFIAMELFSGQSLERVLRTSGPMTLARAIPILVQVARSLANAHMAGVLHREVTSRSVLVGRGDIVKVGDYGLGRGDDASGSEADVLGFGRIGVAMLRGRTPASPQAMLDKVSTTIPADLHKLLAQCLDPIVSARPRAVEIEARLLAIGTEPASPQPVVAPAIVAQPPYAPPIVARAITARPITTPPIAAPPIAAPPLAMAPARPSVTIEVAPVAVIESAPAPVPVPAIEPEAIAPPVDSLDHADDDESSEGFSPRPRQRGLWIAGGAVVAAAIVTLIVMYATSGHTQQRIEQAAAPPTPPTTEHVVAPEHVVVHEVAPPPPTTTPDPTPTPPTPPAPAPSPTAIATAAVPPSPRATPAPKSIATPAPPASKKAKHKDDAVIVDPFSD